MVGVMTLSGGTNAVLNRIAGKIENRRHGQLLIWLSGLLVFFDDYANTLLIGSTINGWEVFLATFPYRRAITFRGQ